MWGLDWASGYGQLGPVIDHDGGQVTRILHVINGRRPLRMMRTTTSLGFPSLDISYRHDAENGGGLARFGQTEWPDVEGAVRYALDHGARRVILTGMSMGAAPDAAFLENSPLANRVEALIFDAPMLDFGAMIDYGADQSSLPGLSTPVAHPLVWGAKQLSANRFGLDLSSVNYLDDTAWLKTPALVFHGTEDSKIPVSVTRRLTAAKPTQVTAVYVAQAGHVESWNWGAWAIRRPRTRVPCPLCPAPVAAAARARFRQLPFDRGGVRASGGGPMSTHLASDLAVRLGGARRTNVLLSQPEQAD